ncbi:hypothetical protein POTOM_020901 [Populus tomentosa]|uniref:Uncharacterized protein n=1 Tax=Populus tomentosa TaxID=118781 RepID=A0A8X7ZQ92_POPTO|nr:hypothetical protein POTOM_020901 [Populus tomentosa]
MFDLGDELTVEGYGIPWLIWIQILVLVLLVILLFCFSFFPSDLSDTTTSSSSASPSAAGVFMPLNYHLDKPTLEHNDHTTTATNCLQHSQVYMKLLVRFIFLLSHVHQNKSIKGEITTNMSRRIVSEDNFGNSANFIDFHPCNYFRLAKLAFLKCFGLDSIFSEVVVQEMNLSREKTVLEICCHLLKRRSILTRTTDPRG